MYKSLVAITLTALSPLCFSDTPFQQELRAGCAKVKSYAATGKQFYDQKQYAKAVEQFEQQAAWSSFCSMNVEDGGIAFTEHAMSTAFNNVGLSYAKLGKPQWARAWFSVYPDAKNSQFNLKQLPAPKQSSHLSGKYVRYAGFGQWNTIEVKRTAKSYALEFNGLYMGIRSLIYGPNIGKFQTTMPFNQTQTSYRANDCKIDLDFKFDSKVGQQLHVKETNIMSCGFGHNVSASGVYLKVE
ncbi:hypothetical protein [Acinetobacter schindleri]|jgi:hypothetical protein|uniref:hypothetical protein n=1 Tax=Acinetobacter schindleri TaxID=108981 RepID=UPI0015D2240D|nr:hypothetical protein Q7C11_13270 [Acinetobacter schindleri]